MSGRGVPVQSPGGAQGAGLCPGGQSPWEYARARAEAPQPPRYCPGEINSASLTFNPRCLEECVL